MKLWWPHDEIMISSMMLYRDTGKKEYLDWFFKTEDYCRTYFSDPAYGEWYGYFKGPFHLPRMLSMVDVMMGELPELK